MNNNYHVAPVNDLIDHNTQSPACECGPRAEVVSENGVVYGTVIVHTALDGRD